MGDTESELAISCSQDRLSVGTGLHLGRGLMETVEQPRLMLGPRVALCKHILCPIAKDNMHTAH